MIPMVVLKLPLKCGDVLVDGRWKPSSDKNGMSPDLDIPAVVYVRMSTDHQKYSTENQLDVIRHYANSRGLSIVRVFEDSGRSGLVLDGRKALQSLMVEGRCCRKVA